jgi:predicted DNA-binding helix-hairpin-helix protein
MVSPLIRSAPSTADKLALLGEAAQYDLSCSCGAGQSRTRGPSGQWIYPAALPSGQRVPMLKVLQQSGCERGCAYCVERFGGHGPDVSFSPDELASLFDELRGSGRVAGLFLSSAIRGGGVATMDKMLATASILRRRYQFRGYLHLKLVPGCTPDQVDAAMALATRVSVNLEAPNAARLSAIAPQKLFDSEIVAPMRQVATAIGEGRFARSGQTTQLVVGAGAETDAELGRAAALLYRRLGLARVYYSAFQPVPGTPLAGRPPTPLLREHRLYQLDFLLRVYGFDIAEIPFQKDGSLSLAKDPKTAWAEVHPELFPLEIDTASEAQLRRVPGIGPVSARRLIEARRQGSIRSLETLRRLGASDQHAAPFVLLGGRRPPCQLPLPGISKEPTV